MDVPLGSSSVLINLAIVIVSILLFTFFTSSEAVLISANKIRLRHLAEQGSAAARSAERVLGQHEKFFATVILGQNLFVILASSLGTAIAINLFGGEGVLIATVLMTVLIVIFGEVTPKALAVRISDRLALLVAQPIELIMKISTPVAYVLALLPRAIYKLMGGEATTAPTISEAELRMLIEEEGTVVEEAKGEMLSKVFEFGERQVHEVMVPRPDIVSVPENATLADFLATYSEHPHSRFPVYGEEADEVVGILNIKDVLMAQAKGTIDMDSSVRQLARSAYFVPDSKRVTQLFTEMQSQGIQMAMVVDEFGGIAGLVTLEQLVEEIVGQMGDELRRGTKEFETIDEKTIQVDGGMRIDEANEQLSLEIPEGYYETIAGFILDVLGHVPHPGEQINYNGLKFTVVEMDGFKIEKVQVTRS